MKNFLSRLFHRQKPSVSREDNILHNGMVIEAWQKTESFELFLELADSLHTKHAAASKDSLWEAGAAYATLELTDSLKQTIRRRNEILKALGDAEERKKLGSEGPKPQYTNSPDESFADTSVEPVTI